MGNTRCCTAHQAIAVENRLPAFIPVGPVQPAEAGSTVAVVVGTAKPREGQVGIPDRFHAVVAS